MTRGKEENEYENVTRVIRHQQLGKGKPPETSQKRAVIIPAVLILLSLSLAASLATVTVKYHQELREKHRVAEGIQRLKDSLKRNNVSYASALEQNGLPLLDELQQLMGALGELIASCAADAIRKQYSDFQTKLSTGWTFYGGNLYYFSQETKSWEKAERFCVSRNSHLTSILTQGEQDYLVNATLGKSHWIGLTDQGREGDWRWVDGAEYTGGFWSPGQPDNWNQDIGGTEDCAAIEVLRNELWNDANCTVLERWICKFAGPV